MKTYISEVLPALLAMVIMGIAGVMLAILYETMRSHMKKAFASARTVRFAEKAPIVTEIPAQIVEAEPAPEAEDEPAIEDLNFDGDAGMFEGDFGDPVEASLLAPSDIAPEFSEQPEQIELALDRSPAENMQRDGKLRRREREAKSDRRSRKAEMRPDDAGDETRRRSRKDRETEAEDVRALRQQNRHKNRQ